MVKNNKNYLVNYLNALIHGLLSATQKYTYYILSEKHYREEDKIEEFIEECKKKAEKEMKKIQDSHRASIPVLISFKIGDLLRSKCSSKENEIISLYNELLKINHYDPNLLKIVKVKNRLAHVTKDILVDLLYRN